MIGKTATFRAKVGLLTHNEDRLCLEEVTIEQNGRFKPFKDHTWVKSSKRTDGVLYGDYIEFRALVIQYDGIGIDGKQCTKIGIGKLRSIKRIEK